eukprot:GHVQ01003514.1.p1 GENE.GHVQ01003514.1~~GHVQ01003514.1.p1  ORF type:complete len:609 (+),score=67.61 GHVQ01003514.1:86-1828(+)
MVNVSLIILIVGLVAFMLIGFVIDLKLLFHYEHTDDGTLNRQIFAKLTILLGLQLGWLMVVLLPIDVYNYNPPVLGDGGSLEGGGMNMRLFWQTVWWLVAVYLVVLLPFASFYYEADDDPRITKQPAWRRALCYMMFLLVIVGLILGVLYALLRKATITVNEISCSTWHLPNDTAASHGGIVADVNNLCMTRDPTKSIDVHKEITVGFSTFLMASMVFVGWWFFVLFGGIGLSALPLDLIVDFIDRPKPIDLASFGDRKRTLGEKARVLKLVGESLAKQTENMAERDGGSTHTSQQTMAKGLATWTSQRKHRQAIKSDLNKYRQAVFVLEREYNHLNISLKERGENPFYSYIKLFMGIMAGVVSLMWWVHVVMFMVVTKAAKIDASNPSYKYLRFIDAMLDSISKTKVGLLAVVIYALLVCYLLLCVMKGCFKFGMRVFCCFAIHPMKKDETHLNSFLFNVALILISSTAVIQFSQQAFRNYGAETAAMWIFEVQLHAMKFFGAFFRTNAFVYMLLSWSLITAIYLFIKPRDRIALSSLSVRTLPDHLHIQAEAELEQRRCQKEKSNRSKLLKDKSQTSR